MGKLKAISRLWILTCHVCVTIVLSRTRNYFISSERCVSLQDEKNQIMTTNVWLVQVTYGIYLAI